MVFHHALFIPEIGQHICELTQRPENGEDSVPGRVESQALARLAQVCKALSEPALRILWRDIPNFSPLIRLFSGCKRLGKDFNKAYVSAMCFVLRLFDYANYTHSSLPGTAR